MEADVPFRAVPNSLTAEPDRAKDIKHTMSDSRGTSTYNQGINSEFPTLGAVHAGLGLY